MGNINEILGFHFSRSTFQQSADRIISVGLSRQFETHLERLQRIKGSLNVPVANKNISNLIPFAFKKFKSSVNSVGVIWERRELRTLTYALSYSESGESSIISDLVDTERVLSLLNGEWRDSFLFGIIDCYLRNWESDYIDSLNKIESFIVDKLISYSGNRSSLVSIKRNLKYFDHRNGDLVLGYEMALNSISVRNLTSVLSLPDSWGVYPYFSKVLLAYYEKRRIELPILLDDFDFALELHKRSNTSKRIVSKFIIQANEPEYAMVQDSVKQMAFKFIGDPENKGLWSGFTGATEQELSDLQRARTILNEWITRQFINVFFNVCINDERRKRFWLKYAGKISSFKVYGPRFTKNILKRIDNVSKYIDPRFETVNSSKDISAFIIYIGQYMLIEFSNEGYAFYAFKVNGTRKPDLNKRLNSVDDLRDGSMPMLLEDDYFYRDEGRLRHHDGKEMWESKFDRWLQVKVIR